MSSSKILHSANQTIISPVKGADDTYIEVKTPVSVRKAAPIETRAKVDENTIVNLKDMPSSPMPATGIADEEYDRLVELMKAGEFKEKAKEEAGQSLVPVYQKTRD